ncbi:MAG: methyltransferase domain-containing protein [Clostridiales bacterium]|nr:methyltransferase domain-containing protein [Clostridiales bacterium]
MKKHCFDIAKSGYVTLTRASGGAGDDKDMVRARTDFLDTGAYQPFADAIVKHLTDAQVVVDAGCGEGYYTNYIAAENSSAMVYGFDLSKAACDHAAKRAKQTLGQDNNTFFGVSSLFELPIADNSVDAVVNLFAPVAEQEFSRVLRDGGLLIIGAAGKRHLIELKEAIYQTAYENEGRRDLPSGFEIVSQESVSYKFMCMGDKLKKLFMMTPYAFRTSKSDADKLDSIDKLEITADFDIYIFKKSGK